MKKNIGTVDQTVRILIAIVIGVLYFTNVISGTLSIVLGVLAIVLVVTSFFSFCPLYMPFNMNTCKTKK